MDGWMDGRTDGRTDGWGKVSPQGKSEANHLGNMVFMIIVLVCVVILEDYQGTFGTGLRKGRPLKNATNWHAGPRCVLAGKSKQARLPGVWGGKLPWTEPCPAPPLLSPSSRQHSKESFGLANMAS